MDAGNTSPPAIVAAPLDPRQDRLRRIVVALVEAGEFREARDVLSGFLRELDTQRLRHIESVFQKWADLPADDRPDFLTYAHHRRDPSIEFEG